MSKYKNINSIIIYYVLTITLDVSSIGTHTHLLVFVINYRIIRLYCLKPIVLGIILTQGMSPAPSPNMLRGDNTGIVLMAEVYPRIEKITY